VSAARAAAGTLAFPPGLPACIGTAATAPVDFFRRGFAALVGVAVGVDVGVGPAVIDLLGVPPGDTEPRPELAAVGAASAPQPASANAVTRRASKGIARQPRSTS
jgi:hypothetical protein